MRNAPASLFLYSLSAGLCLMCLALLLHPMSPEDFLLLWLTSPGTTLRHGYGIQAAILFWTGTVPAAIGLVGLLHRAGRFVRRRIGPRRIDPISWPGTYPARGMVFLGDQRLSSR